MQSRIENSVESKKDISQVKTRDPLCLLEGPGIDGNIKLNIISFLTTRDREAMNSIRHFRGDISEANPLPDKGPKLFQHYKTIPKKLFKDLNQCGDAYCECDPCGVGGIYRQLFVDDSTSDGYYIAKDLDPPDEGALCQLFTTCSYCNREDDGDCGPVCCTLFNCIMCLPCYLPRLTCTFLSGLLSSFSCVYGVAIDARDAYQIKHRKNESGFELKKFSIYAQKQQARLTSPQDQSMENKEIKSDLGLIPEHETTMLGL